MSSVLTAVIPNSTSFDLSEREPLILPPLEVMLATIVGNFLSIFSQIIVIMISLGLDGDNSAQTIMIVQSVAEIIKRVSTFPLVLCGLTGGDGWICLYLTDLVAYNLKEAVIRFARSIPDVLAFLLSFDRYIAIKYAAWYRENCTRRTAWYVVAPALLIRVPDVALILWMSNWTTSGDGFSNTTSLHLSVVNTAVDVLGAVMVLANTIVTSFLIKEIVRRRNRGVTRQSNESKANTVTRVLAIYSVIYSLFGVIQYALMLPIHIRVNETTFLLGGAAYLSSAIAQIVQAPIFLFISSMRQALLKTLVRNGR
ncbi:uncharacterized protein LOC134854956 [Symsagittifera roscoffensis]|uniref:uncharacterized protein LOC134854956 n=1 Tax=Symsagittifera roscoffensis TaxID=84072 RepID=UPI00307C731F